MPGEAVPKHVAIVSVTGKEFKSESIRLKTVRPFVMKEIALQDSSEMRAIATKDENRPEITRYLIDVVEGLIREAHKSWQEVQEEDTAEDGEPPLPLIRLRVEYTAPEGGKFDCENPQRFSNRFVDKVANVNDVIQFHRKKTSSTRRSKAEAEMPEESVMAQMSMDSIKVEKLVREFLAAQTLTILPQNSFGDAVSQFIDKDDKHAMNAFVDESLANQVKHLKTLDDDDDPDEIINHMEEYKSKLEDMFASGHLKRAHKSKTKPKPEGWDSDEDGAWAEQPGAIIRSGDEGGNDVADDFSDGSVQTKKGTSSRGRGRGRAGKATGTTRSTAASKKKPAPAKKSTAKSRRNISDDDEEEELEDPMVISDDDDDDDENNLFVGPSTKKAPAKAPARKTPARTAAPKSAAAKQSTLTFSQTPAPTQTRTTGVVGASRNRRQEPVSVKPVEMYMTKMLTCHRATTRFLMMMMHLNLRLQLRVLGKAVDKLFSY